MARIHFPRYFRYGLRTLFVVVTVLCIYLGWQLRIVQERKAIIARIIQRGGHVTRVEPDRWDSYHNGGYTPSISQLRAWLGDEPVGFIDVPEDTELSSCDREAVQNAFPEAVRVFEEYQH